MVVLVEAVALECDADLAEHLLDRTLARSDALRRTTGGRAGDERVLAERLPELELGLAPFAAVVEVEDTGIVVLSDRTIVR